MALTTNDLEQIKKIVTDASSAIRADMTTKTDLNQMEGRLVTAMNLIERDVFARLDGHERRIIKLEQKGASA
ncbi:MAG: hypothetical protein JWN01_1122 [Patescibacteria group bacterium]|nr:hypothetical protein [Patescibacteria group bacterium]